MSQTLGGERDSTNHALVKYDRFYTHWRKLPVLIIKVISLRTVQCTVLLFQTPFDYNSLKVISLSLRWLRLSVTYFTSLPITSKFVPEMAVFVPLLAQFTTLIAK